MKAIKIDAKDRVRRPAPAPLAEIDSYEGTLAHAMALAPAIRSERAALASIPPVEDKQSIPVVIRHLATFIMTIAAAACAQILVPHVTPLVVLLAAAFGFAAAASGDRLGSALRALRTPSKRSRAVLAFAFVGRSAEIALVLVSATLVGSSLLAGIGLALAATVAATISHRAQVRDVEMEARAAVREQARIRLNAAEQAAGRALGAVRAAHAADLARLALAMDHSDRSSTDGSDGAEAVADEWDVGEESESRNTPVRPMAA